MAVVGTGAVTTPRFLAVVYHPLDLLLSFEAWETLSGSPPATESECLGRPTRPPPRDENPLGPSQRRVRKSDRGPRG